MTAAAALYQGGEKAAGLMSLAPAMMQARGWLGPLVTQNVDRLHSRAGYKDVLELHGTTHRCWPAIQLTS